MAGSRKGERRGGKRKVAVAPKSEGVKATPHIKKPRKPKSAPLRTEEYYRDITQVITGAAVRDEIEPREVMLDAMRYFHALSLESRQHALHIMRQLATCETEADFLKIDAALADSELRTRELLLLAVDCGFKVAPYCHSKLSTIEVSGPDKGPIEIVGALLAEIATETRDKPSWAHELELEADR